MLTRTIIYQVLGGHEYRSVTLVPPHGHITLILILLLLMDTGTIGVKTDTSQPVAAVHKDYSPP